MRGTTILKRTGGGAADGSSDVTLTIGPLIDVTFQLLIFFMCAMRFKSLDHKLEATLPKDRGFRQSLDRIIERPKISVVLRRDAGEERTRIRLLDREVGSGEEGFRRLDTAIRQICATPDAGDFPGFIAASAEVPHGDVIRCIDSFVAAGVETLEFEGARPPGPGR